MHSPTVRIQADDFDLLAEQRELLAQRPGTGAIVSFVGLVRGVSQGQALSAMTIEHYPRMTEAVIQAVINETIERFDIHAARVVHRVGRLNAGENIVLVLIAAPHRGPAFEACEFLMDHLKTQAPFWKKEHRADGDYWVEARLEDAQALARWTAFNQPLTPPPAFSSPVTLKPT